jgi:hypothetical protein
MAKRKALSALIILSAAFAAPVFARDAVGPGYGARSRSSSRTIGRTIADRMIRIFAERTISRERHSMRVR